MTAVRLFWLIDHGRPARLIERGSGPLIAAPGTAGDGEL